MLSTRQAGILLHPTSLSGPQGCGTLGDEAFQFVDFLVSAGQSVWQVLPLSPTGYGDCPYSSFSAFAGNPALISLHKLAEMGDLDPTELPEAHAENARIDFKACATAREPLLRHAARHLLEQAPSNKRHQRFSEFCQRQASWLNDYAFYCAMRRESQDQGWLKWPTAVRERSDTALQHAGTHLQDEISYQKYLQFVFFEQWFALKEYANTKKIQILGDMPIFVALDSADVWANRRLFQLDEWGKPSVLSGVPPDYFSKTGQLWGNPLYDWPQHAEDKYAWWRARLKWNLEQFDLLRIDHFRGFDACWAVPAGAKNAIDGNWQAGPKYDFFQKMNDALGELPLIAEDLGVITPEIEALRDSFNLPGMKILQFAFDSGPKNPYLPHHHPQNSVVYTGTHDNTTSLAWWKALSTMAKDRVRLYLDSNCRDMPWPLIRTAYASSARLAIIPLQDALQLGGQARMNRPGTASGNWNWRLGARQCTPEIAARLRELALRYDRIPKQIKNT